MKSNKEILKLSLPSIATTFFILIVILLFKPSFPALLLGITLLIIAKAIYNKRSVTDTGGEVLGVIVIISLIKIFYDTFGAGGLWSLLAVVFFLAGVILWRSRKQFLDVIRSIEKQYFGLTAEERKELRKNEKRK